MGARRIRREQRDVDQAESKHRNGIRKAKERVRRDARMKEAIRGGKWPYTPATLSWLSAQLGKPARLIKPEEVASLLK